MENNLEMKEQIKDYQKRIATAKACLGSVLLSLAPLNEHNISPKLQKYIDDISNNTVKADNVLPDNVKDKE